ncbi:hypothetical protein N0V82_007272 [Gnomoniopsis sp. IMI 355080]|nr:hypothetical protein N0V82_007272 [Gnomoniopsis sp. IMI 355080]
MSCYPDNLEAIGAPGPSLSFLRIQYLEEHGVLPGPDLDKELLSKYWEANPPSQEGNTYPSTYNTDQAIQWYQEQPYQHDQQQMTADGHLKLVKRRPDLAPHIGSSPSEIYSSPAHAYQHGAVAVYDSAAPVMPDTPTPLTASFFSSATAGQGNDISLSNGVAPVHGYGVPFANGAASVSDCNVSISNHPSPGSNLDDPFVTKPSTNSLEDAPAPAPAPSKPAPRRKATRVVRRGGRSNKFKNRWHKQELALVVFLRKTKDMGWPEIHQILGTHTPGSIADKYWQLDRLRRGLKK